MGRVHPKIVFVIDGLGAGGAERSLAELLPSLRADGFDIVVVTLHARVEGVESSLVGDGFDIRRLRSRTTLGRARELRAILRAEQPDIVHTSLHTATIVGRLASRGGDATVLTSLVNVVDPEVRLRNPDVSRLGLRRSLWVDRWTARRMTDRFHAITVAVRDSAVEHLAIPAEQIDVIERGRSRDRLGLPSAERRERTRVALGIPQSAEVLVNVGRQEYQKGQRDLLDAFEQLAPSRPELMVMIVGRSGRSTPELEERRAQSAAPDRILFLGHRDDVADLLAAADVFVFPSRFEGLGGAVIEALAMALPVVACDIPVMREVLDDGEDALLVPPGDPTALAAAIRRLLDDDSERLRFGAHGATQFEARFTAERSVARMEQLYRSLVTATSRDEVLPRGE